MALLRVDPAEGSPFPPSRARPAASPVCCPGARSCRLFPSSLLPQGLCSAVRLCPSTHRCLAHHSGGLSCCLGTVPPPDPWLPAHPLHGTSYLSDCLVVPRPLSEREARGPWAPCGVGAGREACPSPFPARPCCLLECGRGTGYFWAQSGALASGGRREAGCGTPGPVRLWSHRPYAWFSLLHVLPLFLKTGLLTLTLSPSCSAPRRL